MLLGIGVDNKPPGLCTGLGHADVCGWVQETETLGGVSRAPVTVLTRAPDTCGLSSVTGVFQGMVGVSGICFH